MIKAKEINLDQIMVSETNPRKAFDKTLLAELASSIKLNGVIEPIVVRPMGDKFEIICGERRYKASEIAGLLTIPSVIKDATDEEAMELQAIENLQRNDLNPIDEAKGFEALSKKAECTREDLAIRLGKSVNFVNSRLKLLNLPKNIQKAIASDVITSGHGEVLARIVDPEEQQDLFDKIIGDKLSVRSSENLMEDYGRMLNSAKFNKSDCLKCESNGQSQVGLFDKDTDLKGKCLNATCFKAKVVAYIEQLSQDVIAKGFKVLKEETMLKDSQTGYISHVNFDDKDYGLTNTTYRKALGKNYKEKCLSCDKHCYIVAKGRGYGNMSDMESFQEWCLNEKCLRSIGKKETADEDDSVVDKDRLKQKSINQARDAKLRFWKYMLTQHCTNQSNMAIYLYTILTLVPFLNKRMDQILPEDYYTKTEWGALSTTVSKLYNLDAKQFNDIQEKIALITIDTQTGVTIQDDDLETLSDKLGYTLIDNFAIDEAFLKPKTKEQLLGLAKEVGLIAYLIKPIKDMTVKKYEDTFLNMKKSEIVDLFLDSGFDLKNKVPKDIAK